MKTFQFRFGQNVVIKTVFVNKHLKQKYSDLFLTLPFLLPVSRIFQSYQRPRQIFKIKNENSLITRKMAPKSR